MKISRSVARQIKSLGITDFFGIPGIHNLPIYTALFEEGFRLITVRHEQSAAFMADGYARASGKIGGCIVIDGPGFLNAATGIAAAKADSIPMIVLTPAGGKTKVGALHELTGQDVVSREICRSHLRLDEGVSSQTIEDFLNKALDRTRPGPVHIEIPLSRFDDAMVELTQPIKQSAFSPAHGPLDQAKECLFMAESPLIIVGGGALGAQQEVVACAETLDSPVINTTATKAILPLNHPLRVGGSPSMPAMRELINESDVVLAVGTELGETDFNFFFDDDQLNYSNLIRIDIDDTQLDCNAVPRFSLCGHAKDVLPLLAQKRCNDGPAGADRVTRTRTAFEQDRFFNSSMLEFLNVLRDRTEVLVGDSSQPNYYAHWLYEPHKVRGYFHSVTGFGTLGYGIPAAIGAKISRPEANVSCLCGDGGLGFTMSELQTAVDLKLSIPFVVWNNYGFREIDKAVNRTYAGKLYQSPTPPDYRYLADAFGMRYVRPGDLVELGKALEDSHTEALPTVVEVHEPDFVQFDQSENWFERDNRDS